MLETNLGGSYNHRFSEVSEHLSPQQVEVIGWHGALSELEVDVLCGQVIEGTFGIVCLTIDVLQETFHVAGRVLRTSSIESVGKKEDHARLSQPLSLRALEVLVNYELSRLVEVSELSFPDAQILGVFKGVTILVGHWS